MKKIKFSLTEKQIAFLSIAVLTVVLIPMLVIAWYNHPSFDDFGYAIYTSKAYNEHTSIIGAAFEQVKQTYFGWQGTFSAVFLFSLQPAIFGEKFYCFTTVIMLGSLIASVAFFMKTLCKDVLKFSKYNTITLTCVILVLCTQLLESAVEGFYWYNGSVYYTFFFSLMLFFFSVIIRQLFVKKDKKGWPSLIAAPILSAIIAGGNYTTALLTIVVLFFFCAYVVLKRKQYPLYSRLWTYALFAIFAICFFISIKAPGNSVRQAFFDKQNPIHAILQAFKFTFDYTKKWCGDFVIPMVMLLITPVLYREAKKSSFAFKYPLIAPIIAVVAMAIQFTPPSYALNFPSEGRLRNIIFYSFVILFVFCIYYFCGWISHQLLQKETDEERNTENLHFKKTNLLYYASVGIIAVALLVNAPNFNHVTSVSAVVSLKNGEAQEYDEQINERLKELQDPSKKVLVFEPIKARPYLLFSDDGSGAIAPYYGKESVTIKTK